MKSNFFCITSFFWNEFEYAHELHTYWICPNLHRQKRHSYVWQIHRPNLHPIILLSMGDGNAAFRLASNLKTAWLGSTCQEYGVSAYAIRTYSISVTLMCIFKLIYKETCNTKKSNFSCILLLYKVLLW